MQRISTLKQHPELREVNYGSLYRKSKKWVEQHIPEYKTDPDYVFPEGESFREMQKRSARCLGELAEKHEDKTILILGHAGVKRGLVCQFLDLNYGKNLRQKISQSYIGDFQFIGNKCVGYRELGQPSGFIESGEVSSGD